MDPLHQVEARNVGIAITDQHRSAPMRVIVHYTTGRDGTNVLKATIEQILPPLKTSDDSCDHRNGWGGNMVLAS